MKSISHLIRRSSRSSVVAGAIALPVLLLSAPGALRADWNNLTGAETAPNIAEIYILDDRVKLVLEVYIDDLERFEALTPDGWLEDTGKTRPASAERARSFSQKTFKFVTETGEALGARFEVIERRLRKDRQSPFIGMINPFTRERVRGPPEDKRVVYAEVDYLFGEPPFAERPSELTIVPPLDDEMRALATVGFIVYHKAVPVIDFRYLSGPSRVKLDWDDPWYSTFDNRNLRRHHKSALMSFLYIEPLEVRHEVLTRVKDLENWMDLGLRGDRYIEIDELDSLRRRIGEFLLTKNPVRIDGKLAKPILDRSSYVEVGLNGIQLLEAPQRLEISSAIVGLILAYITDGMPREVTVNWELFTDQIQRVPATSIDPAGSLPTTVDPEDPVHTWTNHLKSYRAPTVELVSMDERLTSMELPLGSALCLIALAPVAWQLRRRRTAARSTLMPATALMFLIAGALALYPFARVTIAKPASLAPMLSDEDARTILEGVLRNIYRAFDFREEEDVYDKLALTVRGDLLADIYLQNRKSLEVKNAGGARARVKEMEILEASVESRTSSPLSYTIKGRWTVLGTVGHWGHVHVRQNRYDALVTVEGVDGNWKIARMEILEETRIDPAATATGSDASQNSDMGSSSGAER